MSLIPIADGHCDFLYYMVQNGADITRKGRCCINVGNLKTGGVALQCFAAWVDTKLKTGYLEQVMAMARAYHTLKEQDEAFTELTKGFVPGNGQIATLLTVEGGGEAVEGRLENLHMLHEQGVKCMTLTWNEVNDAASPATRRINRGLTSFGREMVEEMDRLGMALDVAHLSDAGIEQALSIMKNPIYASHSNSRAVLNHKRSLPDELIAEIARRGGVVGVNFHGPQLTKSGTALIKDVVRHMRHIAEVGGVECVAIGSDFDGMIEYPADLPSPAHYPKLVDALLQSGFSEVDVRKIAFENLHSYLLRFC